MIGSEVSSPYLPLPAQVEEVIIENGQVKTFVLTVKQQASSRNFSWQPGQFVMVSMPHCGEAPISISSAPGEGLLRLSVRRAGRLTAAMHELRIGDTVGLRGPYGRPFPVEQLKGNDLIFVAGGIGMAPLRAVIMNCLAEPAAYGRLSILYGCRTPDDLVFRSELELWRGTPGVSCLVTVDEGAPGWTGPIGVVTTLLASLCPDPENTVALVCGPPVMIRFALADLCRLGLPDERIFTTLERHMKCGIGVCRHCHLDAALVCVDGPVFTLAELRRFKVMELSS